LAAALDYRMWSDCGVVVCHVIGLLTLASMRELRAAVARRVSPTTQVVVLDLRKCVTAIDPEGWGVIADESVMRRPIAIVCCGPELHTAHAHAKMVAAKGLTRYVFPDLAGALLWAAREVGAIGGSSASSRRTLVS
jgi:hypothetical protein